MFQIWVYWIGFGDLWLGQCAFPPGDRNLPLLHRIPGVFYQNVIHAISFRKLYHLQALDPAVVDDLEAMRLCSPRKQ